MPSVIILDTGILSNSVVPLARPGKTPTLSERCRQWLTDCENGGILIAVPAVAYYETLRDLEHRRAVKKIERLKQFVFQTPDRFLPLTTAHLEKAALLWGQARRAGQPTASYVALDVDVILSAQALSLGLSRSDYIVATTNVRHIAQFVLADTWTNIKP